MSTQDMSEVKHHVPRNRYNGLPNGIVVSTIDNLAPSILTVFILTCTKSQFMQVLRQNVVTNTLKTAKIIKGDITHYHIA